MKRTLAILALVPIFTGCGASDLERQKLAFEQQKYKDEQVAKAEAARKDEQDKAEQTTHWITCRRAATEQYDNDLKNWGSPVPGKPGIRSGPANQLHEMKNLLQRQNEQCDRNFPRGVSW